MRHRLVEPCTVLFGPFGKAVAWQVHQPPRLVDGEKVNELGKPGRRRDASQAVTSRQQVQQRRLADVRTPDEGEFGQRLVRTRIQVRRAAIKYGG